MKIKLSIITVIIALGSHVSAFTKDDSPELNNNFSASGQKLAFNQDDASNFNITYPIYSIKKADTESGLKGRNLHQDHSIMQYSKIENKKAKTQKVFVTNKKVKMKVVGRNKKTIDEIIAKNSKEITYSNMLAKQQYKFSHSSNHKNEGLYSSLGRNLVSSTKKY